MESRIDFFLISGNIEVEVTENSTITSGVDSDHSAVKLSIKNVNTKGKGETQEPKRVFKPKLKTKKANPRFLKEVLSKVEIREDKTVQQLYKWVRESRTKGGNTQRHINNLLEQLNSIIYMTVEEAVGTTIDPTDKHRGG